MSVFERKFILLITQDLLGINGTEFEYLCRYVMQMIIQTDVQQKGHNLYGKPVGYSADFNTDNFKVVGQCGTDKSYFSINIDKKLTIKNNKPLKDIHSAITNCPQCESVLLFVNQRAKGRELSILHQAIDQLVIFDEYDVQVYDSEKIARVIVDNLHASIPIMSILEYLPTSKLFYDMFPRTHSFPGISSSYFPRPVESNIIEHLSENSYLQLWGLSGIGKTQTAINIVKSLLHQYDTIIWIDGTSLNMDPIDFFCIQTTAHKHETNLSFLLEKFKIILVFDNLNGKVDHVISEFNRFNKNSSCCIITSLLQSLSDEYSFHLDKLPDELSFNILREVPQLLDEQINKFISVIGGIPLLLEMIKSLLQKGRLTANEILKDIGAIFSIGDSDNPSQRIAERLLGYSVQLYGEELALIHFLGSEKCDKGFLNASIGAIKLSELKRHAIIKEQDSNFYRVHSFILSALAALNLRSDASVTKVSDYLNSIRDQRGLDYYRFMALHLPILESAIESNSIPDNMRKWFIYDLILIMDNSSNGARLLSLVNSMEPLHNDTIDVLLTIEKLEIQMLLAKVAGNNDRRVEIGEEGICFLRSELDRSNPLMEQTLKHHLAKLYFWLGDFDKAIELFSDILANNPESWWASLQLSRIYSTQKNYHKKRTVLKSIFEHAKGKTVPLSILFSLYEELSPRSFGDLRKEYLDENIKLFTSQITLSISSGFSLPYSCLESLAGHLSYNFPSYFSIICESLPVPSNLDTNNAMKISYARIMHAYFRCLLFHSASDRDQKELDYAFSSSEYYYENAHLSSDFLLRQYATLYIDANKYSEALNIVDKFSDQSDVYNLQTISKAQRGMGNFRKAIATINKAIHSKEAAREIDPFLAAFYHDRAVAQHTARFKTCIKSLEKAISLQSNSKTISSWSDKLIVWNSQIENW